MNYDKIGAFIATKRKEKNLTQKDLAKLLGVTDKAVSKWERGLGCPDVSLLEILANALDVSILEILKGRIIENEVIPITEANDYVLETVNYTNNEVKKKYDKMILNFITIIIISVCSLLLFLNIYHIIYLNRTESYDFGDSNVISEIKNKINQIEINLNRLKNEQSIYEAEDKEEIISRLETLINEYKNLSILEFAENKKFKIKDIYLMDIENPNSLVLINCYNILIKYSKEVEENLNRFKNIYVMKTFIGSNLYSKPIVAYKYNVTEYKKDNLVYSDNIKPRLYNLNWYLDEILFFLNQTIKVGDINE